jgi:hypothetical protein
MRHTPASLPRGTPWVRSGGIAALAALLAAGSAAAQTCTRTITAEVVALDQSIWYNRLGARDPAGMIFALKGDVVPISGSTLGAGNVQLRPGKRPRPLTLRANEGDCLQIVFTNYLAPTPSNNQPGTRAASVHVLGMQLVSAITDDGSNVGRNPSSLVEPGQSRTYTLYAQKEGTYLLHSEGQMTGGDGDGGQISRGMFGAVNVEPAGAEWYRSQVTHTDLLLAQKKVGGVPQVTPGGQPVIDYGAVYPTGHALAGRPILAMLQNGQIVHGDLTAIITGPGRGAFTTSIPPVRVERDRTRPFREYTIIFHDEVGMVQAFNNVFEDPNVEHTLHSGRDAFAINYGTGGIGAEVLANRFRVGPMKDCTECKYEEFFLTSWAVGDPAMVVDVPADADANQDGIPDPGAKATKVFFPDDPSNVYHSYMNDHVKIRNLHAGPKEHHIFHLHAHQWLHSPNSDNSTYLDSQAIGPGGGYTYEITYNGSSNRNKTPADAIFHCHFYPHFAQGMWALWRNHDVFEAGTVLDANDRPVAGARALPDGEIAGGTPIPAIVPLPTYALAPMPTATEPGFPFYIAGVAGHRPPKPPLDTEFDGGLTRHVVRGGTAVAPPLNRLDFSKVNQTLIADSLPEGGTPLELAAMAFHARRSQPSFRFDPNTGAVVADTFITNGRPAVAGAPFADPCEDDSGRAAGIPRIYKAAGFQVDAVYNKAGWHYPQHRMFALWRDVDSVRAGVRPPEPMFIRANTNDCISYHLVNLIPHEYEMDDFQVKTPTDVIGQHIHLVKFDVTSSDGAANGFNYEDGSMSPGEVRERIRAIRAQNGCTGVDAGDARDNRWVCPTAKAHPFFGNGPNGEWKGAQETIQRWYVDNVLNLQGVDRTLRTVFTHDHFGPSTHQQTGLYAGLVTEPKNSTWRDPETGQVFGGRDDGGPTSWRADILTQAADSSYREFNLQIADFTLAYQAGSNHTLRPFTDQVAGHTVLGIADPAKAVNPAGKFEPNPVLPDLLRPPVARNRCPSPTNDTRLTPPCPELVSADEPGTMAVNYRNEPLALRVRNPTTNAQAAGDAGDLSMAFASDVTRADTRFNAQPTTYRPLTNDVRAGDPFTPLLRAYEDDRVQVRILVGAHEEGHNFSVSGTRWLFEPSDDASGFRNSQMMGISEHYEFVLPPLPGNTIGSFADYLYQAGSATDDLWNGMWGIMRAYRSTQNDLLALPSNTDGADALTLTESSYQSYQTAQSTQSSMTVEEGTAEPVPVDEYYYGGATTEESADDPLVGDGYGDSTTVVQPETGSCTGTYSTSSSTSTSGESVAIIDEPCLQSSAFAGKGFGGSHGFKGVCPTDAPLREFDVSAVAASVALPNGRVVYNSRTANGGPLYDPSGILYVFTADLNTNGTLKTGVPVEPLVLRANAGDCVEVTLRNKLPATLVDPDGYNTLPMIIDQFNANHVDPSRRVGLHPQLVQIDVTRSDASKVGFNPRTAVDPGKRQTYQWYAGELRVENGAINPYPAEYGASNLIPSDRVKHPDKGAVAALVVEPLGATWATDAGTRAQATVTKADGSSFREFVLVFQNDLNLHFGSAATLADTVGHTLTFAAGAPIPNLAEAEDAEDSGQKGFNYRTEPLWFRMGFAPNARLEFTRTLNFRRALKNALVGDSLNANPQTPLFTAGAGQSARFRVLHPGGHPRNHVFSLAGHTWEEEPYLPGSRELGHNPLSEFKGSQIGHGPTNHFDMLLKNGAGGRFRVQGDYLYRDQASFYFDGGLWGIMRVGAPVGSPGTDADNTTQTINNFCTVDPNTSAVSCY